MCPDNSAPNVSDTARFLSLILAVLLGLWTGTARAAVWSSSDQWAAWPNGGYTLYNDVWGSGAGPQTIWADSYSSWGSRRTTRTPAA